ncbi:hypothetical protein J6590_006043, partial [Homalodisca vitripennis]
MPIWTPLPFSLMQYWKVASSGRVLIYAQARASAVEIKIMCAGIKGGLEGKPIKAANRVSPLPESTIQEITNQDYRSR